MKTLRTKEVQDEYDIYIANNDDLNKCALCSKSSISSYKYWNIVKNRFPYTVIADTHHMIIPKRHVKESELTFDELKELIELKSTYINENYDLILHQVSKDQSIPEHFHLHLIVGKEDFSSK